MEFKKANILVVIPARGGSKGIPRKNLRSMAGNPLIWYSIKTALASAYNPVVCVSTDDDELATISEKTGALVIKRENKLGTDEVTLDPVIYDVYQKLTSAGQVFDLVVTIQPTSPLLKTSTLDAAIKHLFDNNGIDTLISACNDTHLTWSEKEGEYYPNYEKRLNRQYLKQVFKETGSFLITRAQCVIPTSRIGKKVGLYLLSGSEAIDIDNYEDWSICEFYLRRKKILFVVTGNKEVGLGHAYNVLSIANEIMNHELVFLTDLSSQMAFEKIKDHNYSVFMQKSANIIDDIKDIGPHIVINDILDTQSQYISGLKSLGFKVINFEDLGPGAEMADIVINAMYPERVELNGHYFGHKYFCLKNEFYLTKIKKIVPQVKRVLITFGGVDPNNYTFKVLKAIHEFCMNHHIEIDVIAGFGYNKYDTISGFSQINIHQNIGNISDYMLNADLVFTSAGRTAFELAAVGVPSMVLCQNERELTHFFAGNEYGFMNFGMGTSVSEKIILDEFIKLCHDHKARVAMHEKMVSQGIREGKARVLELIQQLIRQS
ncbi:MAG TPA: hypothetical protein VK177_02600 [Flavobacteriales bacterium]|nr:hypothetical protein [Flavobacteriales bacterium]